MAAPTETRRLTLDATDICEAASLARRRKMRMKLNKSSQLLLVAAASLAAAGMVTACGAFSNTLTADFVYVTSSKAAGTNNYGNVDVMEVNYESGRLRHIPTSPFPSGGRDPVAEAVSPNYLNLYVVNEDDNTVVQFAIGSDGKIYPQNTVNTPGIFPLAVAVSGSHMYVADTYQPLPTCSPAEPCSGSVAAFPLSSSGAPGTPVANPSGNIDYWPLIAPCSPTDVLTPSAINVADSDRYVFVTAFDTTAAAANAASSTSACDVSGVGTAPTGYLFMFAANSGALTAVKGSPFAIAEAGTSGAGVQPSAIASDSSGHVYVTDFAGAVQEPTGARNVYAYTIVSGGLSQVSGSPFGAGNQPAAIALDSTGGYAYVANSLDNTITAYTTSGGALSSFGTYATSTQPMAVLVDPNTGHYVYAANYLAASVSGYQLVTGSGAPTLVVTQNTPYTVDAQSTALVAIPHQVQQ
jgi:6-phosphogluconolactonase